MTDVWLGVIAIAVLVMAVTQVAVLLRLSQVAKEASAATKDLRRELTPLIEKAHRIADDARMRSRGKGRWKAAKHFARQWRQDTIGQAGDGILFVDHQRPAAQPRG